jgi:hypothetical protein
LETVVAKSFMALISAKPFKRKIIFYTNLVNYCSCFLKGFFFRNLAGTIKSCMFVTEKIHIAVSRRVPDKEGS